MDRRFLLSGAGLLVLCSTAPLPAQSSTRLVGCLTRAQDIPGHIPDASTVGGAADDYILTYTDAGGPVGTAGTAASDAVGSSGASAPPTADLGPLYKIAGLSDDRLKALVGKRVEVIGVYDERADRQDDQATASRHGATGSGSHAQTGTDANAGRGDERMDWKEFRATSLREVTGACPSPASSFTR